MPKITEGATRTPFKFKGHTVQVPSHFAVGQPLSELDARFANRQLASVTGNVLASAINRAVAKLQADNDKLPDVAPADQPDAPTKLKDEASKPYVFTEKDLSTTAVQAMFDKIYSDYEIGVVHARGEGIARDPVQSIANNIAWERIKVLLEKRNIKVGSIKGDKKAELIADMLKRDPSIEVAAKAQFEGAAPLDGLDEMFAGMEATAPAAVSPTDPASNPTADGIPGTPPADNSAADTSASAEQPETPADGVTPSEPSTDAPGADGEPADGGPANEGVTPDAPPATPDAETPAPETPPAQTGAFA